MAQRAHMLSDSVMLSRSTPFQTRNIITAKQNPLPRFAHPAESDIAAWLDQNAVPWQYEPTTFPLATDSDGRLLRSFTPDFYLPEDRTYIEMTTMRQSLVTRKNQKFRQMREHYPETSIRLLYRKDVELIQSWYRSTASQPYSISPDPHFTSEQISKRALECARQLMSLTAGAAIRLLATGNGATFAQLIADHLATVASTPAKIEPLAAGATVGAIPPTAIVTGAVGTGLSLRAAHRIFACPVITMLDRPTARMIDMPIWFAGETVGAEWFVGAGLGAGDLDHLHTAGLLA